MINSRHPQQVFIPGPGGRLEAILVRQRSTSKSRAAVIAHPHPRYGGTMHSRVVYHIYRALHEAGFSTLRFNFRGVGESAGDFDQGQGERDDVRAAVDYLLQELPGTALWLAGYSFGAVMALQAGCHDSRVRALLSVATPTSVNDLAFLDSYPKPKFFIQGTRDEFGSVEEMQSLFLSAAEPKELALIEGADHYFSQHLDRLRETIIEFARTG